MYETLYNNVYDKPGKLIKVLNRMLSNGPFCQFVMTRLDGSYYEEDYHINQDGTIPARIESNHLIIDLTILEKVRVNLSQITHISACQWEYEISLYCEYGDDVDTIRLAIC